jgi:predicted transglutaminase-like cysteine proteinase
VKSLKFYLFCLMILNEAKTSTSIFINILCNFNVTILRYLSLKTLIFAFSFAALAACNALQNESSAVPGRPSEFAAYWQGSAAADTQSTSMHWQQWQQKASDESGASDESWRLPGLELARDLSPLDQLRWVQHRANRMPFREDWALWRQADYWAQPREFFTYGGDCEDYALAKLSLLRALGWPEAGMRLLLVQDMGQGGIEHAVLMVAYDGVTYLLDNQSHELLDATKQARYLPRYGMNAEGFWRY